MKLSEQGVSVNIPCTSPYTWQLRDIVINKVIGKGAVCLA